MYVYVKNIHVYVRALVHAYIHTYIHTHIQTYMHTHAQVHADRKSYTHIHPKQISKLYNRVCMYICIDTTDAYKHKQQKYKYISA